MRSVEGMPRWSSGAQEGCHTLCSSRPPALFPHPMMSPLEPFQDPFQHPTYLMQSHPLHDQ